jgi:hypothetical protein
MVAVLYQAYVDVNIENILVSRGVADKNTTKVMSIKFAAVVACAFDPDPGAEQFKVCQVRFDTLIPLKRCFFSFQVNQLIVKID